MLQFVSCLKSVSFLPRFCLLEVMLTRGRWLRFDNGVQVSLGNRRDLAQDAELPLGFFYVPSPLRLPCMPAFLPSQCPLTERKDGSSVPAESEMKSWDIVVISVLMMWELWTAHILTFSHQDSVRFLWWVANHFPLPSYHLTMAHSSDQALCVMSFIDCDCGAVLNAWQYEVRSCLAACVIILLSNLFDRK